MKTQLTIYTFCILTIDCHQQQGNRNIFGLTLPSFVYPWVLLVIVQLLMQNVSFYGHLAGILIGYAYVSYRDDVEVERNVVGLITSL